MDIDSWNFISFDTSTPQVAQDNVIELHTDERSDEHLLTSGWYFEVESPEECYE
jgi:hypothetical protein